MAEHTIAAGSRRAGVESDAPGGFGVFLQGIERTLRIRGTLVQRVLCAALMALLTGAALPGGGYACQIAMFAVVLRLGFCVPAAFVGIMAGFAAQYGLGDLSGCWQLPAATLLWLSTGLWAQRSSRMRMAAAVFLVQLTGVVVMGMTSVLSVAVVVLSAAASAGLSVLYDGAALSVCHRDELDGETRPLCVVAVCASLAAGILPLPGGYVIAGALAAYLTLEHAYVGGAQQAILCAGVVGGVVSLGTRAPCCCAAVSWQGRSRRSGAASVPCSCSVAWRQPARCWGAICRPCGCLPMRCLGLRRSSCSPACSAQR